MLYVVYSPQWFYGKDIVIDIVSAIVLLLVSFFSIRFYRLKRNQNNLLLAVSFTMIAVSFIFKIFMNFHIYYSNVKTTQVGTMLLTYQTIETNRALFFAGFCLYQVLMLLGLYTLYALYEKQPRLNHILIGTLLVALAYFSYQTYYMFHIISVFLLVLILIKYAGNYIDKKYPSTMLMTASFATILLSHILLIMTGFNSTIYVIAEIIQLIGYIMIFITLIMVLKSGSKAHTN